MAILEFRCKQTHDHVSQCTSSVYFNTSTLDGVRVHSVRLLTVNDAPANVYGEAGAAIDDWQRREFSSQYRDASCWLEERPTADDQRSHEVGETVDVTLQWTGSRVDVTLRPLFNAQTIVLYCKGLTSRAIVAERSFGLFKFIIESSFNKSTCKAVTGVTDNTNN